VIYLITQIRPTSILDVGVGFGKWGFLFREYTDIIASERDPTRYPKFGWKVRIEGIEAFKGYLHKGHSFVYDKIHIGDAKEIVNNIGRFDVIFLGDIIEHFRLNEGKELVRSAIKKCNKCVILTTPRYDTGQSVLCNNPLEQHLSLWRQRDFRELGRCMIAKADKATYVVAYPLVPNSRFKLAIKYNRRRSWPAVLKRKYNALKKVFFCEI